MADNNWYVITGAPSSGKSTLIQALSDQGYETVEEMGRLLIDQEMATGKTLEEINVDSAEFEVAWVDLQQQREAPLKKSDTIIFDRGVLDTLAYFEFYGWPIPDQIADWCAKASYKKVFLLELLDYEKDYARVESEDTAKQMQDLFKQAYEKHGYEVVTIPSVSVEERLTLLRQHM